MAIKKISKTVKKDVNYYLNLPWTYTVEQAHDEEGKKIYIIRVDGLPGVSTDGYTFQEAMEMIQEAMALSFEVSLEHGDEIPEPIDESKFQGNIAYRTTPRKHYLIAREAQKKRQSLSQIIDALVEAGLALRRRG